MKQLASILTVLMRCQLCGIVIALGDCEPAMANDGSEGSGFGCPVADCGGMMQEVQPAP